jgi:hypothetical protein
MRSSLLEAHRHHATHDQRHDDDSDADLHKQVAVA